MTQYDPFDILKTYGIGFERELKMFNDLAESTNRFIKNTFPPYNVKKISDNVYFIELAIAGFGKQDIEITTDGNTLTIKGETKLPKDTSEYLFKGIANRSFTRTFNLADTIEIKEATVVNGMLKIWLENLIPESKKPKKIEITDGETQPPTTPKQLLMEERGGI